MQGGFTMAHKIFREVLVSPYEKETECDALNVLQAIRDACPAMYDWKEIQGFVEKLSNGKFRAVREHAQYK